MTQAFEATHRAIGKDRKAVALRTGLSLSLVEKHCIAPQEMGGEGRVSPAQRVIETCLAKKESGDEQWYYLLTYIARELGFVVVEVNVESVRQDTLDHAARVSREFADTLAVVAEAQAAGIASLSHSERIVTESEELIVATYNLRRVHQSRIVRDEAAMNRERRGPHRTAPRIDTLRIEASA